MRQAGDLDAFVAPRRARWQRLENLVRRGRRGVRRLQSEELLELGTLYRLSAADLATARRDFPRDRVTYYLNSLAASAHPLIYQERSLTLRRIGQFARAGFPAAFRRALPYTAASAAVFVATAVAAALLVALRPETADTLLPGTAQSLRAVMAQHHLWVKSATENGAVTANFIMLNNIQVAFIAFALGILAGVGTVVLMAQNGIMLGAVGAMVAQYGLSVPFWAFVAPHGVIELSVIVMAGGAGMMIGDAVLRPGNLPRSRALVHAARNAAAVLAGCVPLLMIAGCFETFLDPSDVPDGVKFAIAAVNAVLLYGYLLRGPSSAVAPTPSGPG